MTLRHRLKLKFRDTFQMTILIEIKTLRGLYQLRTTTISSDLLNQLWSRTCYIEGLWSLSLASIWFIKFLKLVLTWWCERS